MTEAEQLNQLYLQEIQSMMHGCGDNARSLLSTAKVIASIVQQQMLTIAWRADEVAAKRGSRTVTPRDIIFLMRKSPDKLRRLYNYLLVKEMKNKFSDMAGFDLESTTDDMEGDSASVLDLPRNNRQSDLQQLFTGVDISGELLDSLNHPHLDPIRQKREQRADSLSISLDPAAYLEFAKARGASFVHNKLTVNRFLDWIKLATDSSPGLVGEPTLSLPRMTSRAIEILAYLAKETVAMLVDFAIHVRQDSCGTVPGGPLRPLTLRPPSSTAAAGGLERLPLTPAEVREALRRYWSPVFSQSAALVRTGPPMANQIIAC